MKFKIGQIIILNVIFNHGIYYEFITLCNDKKIISKCVDETEYETPSSFYDDCELITDIFCV